MRHQIDAVSPFPVTGNLAFLPDVNVLEFHTERVCACA